MSEYKPVLTYQKLVDFRYTSFRNQPDNHILTEEEALLFVNQRGFIFFWPIKGVLLPSLWCATVGDRPVPNNHDDPGHITWVWKDNMLGKKQWYYARILKRRNTIISLETAPYFYALSPNYGDYRNDYIDQYKQGRMTLEAKNVYEALLQEGPLDTLSLRKQARLINSESGSRFNRAIDDLQIEFKIMPVGVAQTGSWHYSFIYDITPRHFPEVQEYAKNISIDAARRKLLDLYLCSVGAVALNDIPRFFGWQKADVIRAIQGLKVSGKLVDEVTITDRGSNWVVTSALF